MKRFFYLNAFVLALLSPCIAFSQEIKTGCRDYVLPVFPSSARKDYERTCWVARAQNDEFTDISFCQIYPAGTDYDAYPFVYVRKNSISVSVAGGDQYPGSATMIRVDEHEAVSGGSRFNKGSSEVLVKQMSSGSVIKARFSEWPTDTYRTGTMDAAGFAEAVAYCRASVQ